ncbi:helix-turn-helix domain-containing protein [Paraburkholderia sp. BCC1886]|uniref:helix-turn-helix domain-containing protein n=1 Tax=Paraburkholderia sp. BCC1886 TaxID=2562670 RepID=UPI001642D5C5|nr:helix-turn-helix domain-containing protein [Paraburkholderia sp. BCC1886]
MHRDWSPTITRASTETIPAEDRLAYWDEYNASALVGLRTSSLAEAGLNARQTNVALRDLYVAEIEGNDHVIERNPALVRQYPKESVFACHLAKGTGYLVQKGATLTVNAGDTLIYDTRFPFTYGFVSDMRQLLVEIPAAKLTENWGFDGTSLPLKIEPSNSFARALSVELRRGLVGCLREPDADSATRVPALTHTVANSTLHGEASLDTSIYHVLSAKEYVATHLRSADLTTSKIAQHVGVSVRHLNRLFALEDTSLAEYVWAQRAAYAYRDLQVLADNVTIGEIAFSWGFSSHAHFTRTIVSEHGLTPSEIRGLKRST